MLKKSSRLMLIFLLVTTASSGVHPNLPPAFHPVEREALRLEINQLLNEELSAHLGAIASLSPPPVRVLGAGTTGEYTWGTFMRAVAVFAELSKQQRLADRDLARFVGQIGLWEHKLGSKAFSQL